MSAPKVKPDRKARSKSKTGIILELMTVLKSGDSFLTETNAKDVQSNASKMGVKVSTANCLLIENHLTDEPKTSRVTKVTIS